MTDDVAVNFSWHGKKGKREFNKLQCCDVILSTYVELSLLLAEISSTHFCRLPTVPVVPYTKCIWHLAHTLLCPYANHDYDGHQIGTVVDPQVTIKK